MSLIKVDVDRGNLLAREFTELERRNLPFALRQAVNATAFAVRQRWAEIASKVFDTPTPLTIKAAQYHKATFARPYAEIFIRDEALNGTPPAKYLQAQVAGGERARKGLEVLLQGQGCMPAGTFAVPGKGASLDAHGNLKRSQINQVLSQLGTRRDALQNESDTSRDRRRRRSAKRGTRGGEFFSINKRRGRLLPGIYERISTGFGSALKSLFVFVRAARYTPRYDLLGAAQKIFERQLPFHFKRELDKAVQTSKFRGRG
ncbi:MAG TPA: hypothetical protein VEY92_02360 [Pseudoxanthomonas sp.]|nr:hypothetical protein [Pseudoxanthomonas sp.]